MFNSRLVLHSILLGTILFLTSCSDSIESDSPNGNSIIPLNTGNDWNYLITHFDSLGTRISSEYQTEKIIKDTLLNGMKWYSYENYNDGVWFTNKTDGYWVYIEGTSSMSDSKNDTSIQMYKYPTFSGDTYSNRSVLSINDEVTVPAGKYKCIHIFESWKNLNGLIEKMDTYFVPNIGKVMVIQHLINENGDQIVSFKKELKNFNLK